MQRQRHPGEEEPRRRLRCPSAPAEREDLLLATLTKFWQLIAVPDTGTLRDDAIGFLRNADADRSGMITLMSVQLACYFRDTGTSLTELRDTLLPPGQATAFEMIVASAPSAGAVARRRPQP
ncbi:hypothetical protein [Nonomuraea sp. NPDC049158]|uniref:hypothetical protein n=1 Tax=Nonomuraea sp. NPDC049158 TaxID=3155649 RepID=UPI0033E4012D